LVLFCMAGNEEDSMLVNFFGYFDKGPVHRQNFSKVMQQVINLHRQIDKLADNRIISLMNKKEVAFKERRYAGITFDLACDHFLALHWQDFYHREVKIFAQHRIEVLKKKEKFLPEKGKLVLNRMTEYQWLENYQHLEFLEEVFLGIHKRFPRENKIDLAFIDLKSNYASLEESCLNFIKQLQNELLR